MAIGDYWQYGKNHFSHFIWAKLFKSSEKEETMAEYLAEKVDEQGKGTGEKRKITISGADGFYARERAALAEGVKILETLSAEPN